VQNEIVDGAAQVFVLVSHAPLQQSLLVVHALPAVWQPLPSCVQVPFWHASGPLQHWAPPAEHDAPSDRHCVVPQLPLTQFRLQQSPAFAQAPPAALQMAAVH
jgi:hypothetical protein